MGDLAGKYVKNRVLQRIRRTGTFGGRRDCHPPKGENRAFKVEKYVHNYPHCWRTDKPVLYYPMDSWFIRASAAKERMAELNGSINWKPASTGEGRFGKWRKPPGLEPLVPATGAYPCPSGAMPMLRKKSASTA